MNTKATRKTTQPASKAALPVKTAPPALKAPKRYVRASKAQPLPVVAVAAPAGSKQSQLLAMLRSPSGATIEQMTCATGWQPHSVRGVISGVLRKRLKLNVVCTQDPAGGARVYRVAQAT
jgi:hypothetical protein